MARLIKWMLIWIGCMSRLMANEPTIVKLTPPKIKKTPLHGKLEAILLWFQLKPHRKIKRI
jgi:hypothetical protein